MSDTEASKSAPEAMWLREVTIEKFRSCCDATVRLRPSLTVLVGENNAGKSNVIEALRLAISPLSGRRVRYFEPEDVTRQHQGPACVHLAFAGASRFQRAHLIGSLDLASGDITYDNPFYPPSDEYPRGRTDRLSGPGSAPDPEPEKRDQINHVYLAPLRDAQRELDSGSGNRLAAIMRELVTPEIRDDFVATAGSGLDALAAHVAVRSINDRVQHHLTSLTDSVRGQTVGTGFDAPELNRLARSLRLKMSESGIDLEDLEASGLGYANLLFMSTVLLELQNARDSELTLFLVEEPEAHLHPQLQAVLLDFLQAQAESSVRDDAEGPAGRIQVIVTTHSPNLASAVGLENVVVLRSVARLCHGGADHLGTAALPLASIHMAEYDRRKINQYLDVTRSELLFARRVVLVEGIAEAVLLPALAHHCVLKDREDAAAAKRASIPMARPDARYMSGKRKRPDTPRGWANILPLAACYGGLEPSQITRTRTYGQARGAEQYHIENANGPGKGTLQTEARGKPLGKGTEGNRARSYDPARTDKRAQAFKRGYNQERRRVIRTARTCG